MTVKCLTQQEKDDIFDLYADGFFLEDIGAMYGVSRRTIGRVLDEQEEELAMYNAIPHVFQSQVAIAF